MIIRDKSLKPVEEQWDGTDIEPGHPRNTGKPQKPVNDDAYFRRYREGQNCCDG